MRLSILILILSLTYNSIAQTDFSTIKRCGSDNYVANKMLQDSSYLRIVEQTRLNRLKVAESSSSSNKTSRACPDGDIVIPVAVHFDSGIGTNSQERTCLISLVNSQIRALNEAFNGLNDVGCTTSPTGGACITFKLANENHNAASGLQNGDPAITFNGLYTCPYEEPCNVSNWGGYLNIVVQNMGGLLGISPLNGNPGGGGASNAFLVESCAFGTEDIYCNQAGPNSCSSTFSYRRGYTAVHEAGHFYGLEHTFCADDNGNPEGGDECNCFNFNCDGFTDTPAQCHANYSCFSGTCSEVITNPCGGPSIFNNFMDYMPDNCMNSFSDQQTTFMNETADRDIYKRSSLGDLAPVCNFMLRIENGSAYANENENLTVCGTSEFFIEELVLNNPENYNWTFTTTNGLLVDISSSTNPSPVLRLSGNSGQLTISLTASNSNGTCSGTSKTFNVQPSLAFGADFNDIECYNNFAGVKLNVGSSVGNINLSPSSSISGSGTTADPYIAWVDLDEDCGPIVFTARDAGLIIEKGIFEILEPYYIAGDYSVGTNNPDNFGVDIETVRPCVQSNIVLVNDGDGIETDFCISSQPTTSQCNNLNGNIALIDRGDCTFVEKIEDAQACGAIAVVICNCEPFSSDDCQANSATEVLTMSGSSDVIDIPSIFVSYNDCQLIKNALSQENVRACIGDERTGFCTQTITIDPCEITACDPNNIVNGCTNPCAANFNPQATQDDDSCTNIITASINGLPPFTTNATSVPLSGSPAGGTFSGEGVVFTTFNPSVVDIGLNQITYTYDNGNGCVVSDTKSILVSQLTYKFVQYQLDFVNP